MGKSGGGIFGGTGLYIVLGNIDWCILAFADGVFHCVGGVHSAQDSKEDEEISILDIRF